MEEIRFRYDYHKLKRTEFTTVRGVSTGKKFKDGEAVRIMVRGRELCMAMVVKVEFKRLADMTLPEMQADGEFSGFRIISRSDFMGLINSLREPPKKKLESYEAAVSVIHLRKF